MAGAYTPARWVDSRRSAAEKPPVKAPGGQADEGAAPIVVVGAGGIAAPALWALGHAGADHVVVVDDDRVALSNLHRQVLFDEAQVGEPKTRALRASLNARFPSMRVDTVEGRALPDTVVELVARAGVVLDATDNFASRFLLADACYLAGVPVVHAAAVRWQATVLAVAAAGKPCYRCLFEDIPRGDAPNCATAGVAGPVCGVSGAIGADRALRLVRGDTSAVGHIVTFEGRADRLRRVAVAARGDCVLCGAGGSICTIEPSRYE